MRTAARFAFERLAELDRAIRAGEYPNAASVARRLEVARRTVQRDFAFLRDRLRAPLAFDAVRNGYYYTDTTYRLPTLALSEAEIRALALAEQALRQYRGTPFAEALGQALRKITEGLGRQSGLDLADLGDSHSFRTPAARGTDPALFATLEAAVRDRRRLALLYWSASRDELSARQVDPYHLACVDGDWYLVAHCHARGEVRMFAPTRIRHAEEVGESFVRPHDFDVEAYLADAFAVLRGAEGESHRVRLRFSGEAARYVGERIWHPSQTREETPEGGLVLGFTLGHLREVERWALSWGAGCEVLEPPELRRRVGEALKAALDLYVFPRAGPRGKSRKPPGRTQTGREVRGCP